MSLSLSPGETRDNAGSYRELVLAMSSRYPNLKYLLQLFSCDGDSEPYKKCQVAMVEFATLTNPRTSIIFDNPESLARHLADAVNEKGSGHRRVYLMENLEPRYVELVGSYFGIDPCVFSNQIRSTNWEMRAGDGNTPRLVSCRDPAVSFLLRYSEPLYFGGCITRPEELLDATAGRKITVASVGGKINGVGIARRNASFWRREVENNGWDVLLLLDPPVTYCSQGEDKIRAFPNMPYQGGYVDFTPWPTAMHELLTAGIHGPTRQSAFTDLLYYLTHPSTDEQVESNKDIPAILLQKLVLSHYMTLIEYVRSVISTLEWELRAKGNNLDQLESINWIVSGWGHIFAWGRRLSEYCEHIELALDNLRISQLETATPSPITGNCIDDFKHVHHMLLQLKGRTTDLISSVNGLIGIMEAKRSSGDAKAVKILTILGMVFVPLSFTSGVFSMTQNYAPGGPQFWVYFVVAIPLIIVVLAAVFMANRRQGRRSYFWR